MCVTPVLCLRTACVTCVVLYAACVTRAPSSLRQTSEGRDKLPNESDSSNEEDNSEMIGVIAHKPAKQKVRNCPPLLRESETDEGESTAASADRSTLRTILQVSSHTAVQSLR